MESVAMPDPFTAVTDLDALEQLFARSQTGPVILFQHDPYCPISRGAYRRLAQLPGAIPLVDVAHARALGQAIALRTGIRHESPQVLVLYHGEAVWSASHWAITAASVVAAVNVLPPDPWPDPLPVPPEPGPDPRPDPVPMPQPPQPLPLPDVPVR